MTRMRARNPRPETPKLGSRSVATLCVMALAFASFGFDTSSCISDTPVPESGAALFTSPQTNAIALNASGTRLVVANTTSGTVSVYDTSQILTPPDHGLLAEIHVGLDPVGVAIRPGSPELAVVTNHISDSISIVDLTDLTVVQTLQEVDADGVSLTDAPVGVALDGTSRAFITLDDRNEVRVIEFDASGKATLSPTVLTIAAQAPRAVAVGNGKLYVAAFESTNQTEFPSCGPDDPIGLKPGDPIEEGCLFNNRLIDNIEIVGGANFIDFDLGTIVEFAAQDPNLGGEVIIDRRIPDRDVFVFDLSNLAAPPETIDHVGTLLYGLEVVTDATTGVDRVYVSHTDARNHLDGLAALGNKMFDNRVGYFECNGACSAPTLADLDANGFGVPVPTPYGIRASANGNQLVVSVAGSDGLPGLAADPNTDIPGMVVLDANGNVLGHVQTGAIPQSIALASDGLGNAATAYVLNTVDSTVSVVDLTNPAAPTVAATFEVGDDPTPAVVRQGRALFSTARASTNGLFSCESCHPNANMDQLLWTINTVEAPSDVPGCDPGTENCPEPRTTMPIRGLRDTLPLHWVGNLADPFPGLFKAEDGEAPDCNLAIDGEVGCARDLVDASLSGVMCDPLPFCGLGPTGLPGALTDGERNALAAFMMSVSYPPAPERRPDDVLSPLAILGVQDFFTDEDGLGVGSPSANGLGQAVGFAPITCADNSGGCHALPLTVATNSQTVGFFDAPTMRGMWDRYLQFSNGVWSSIEWLEVAQDCADGNPPGPHPNIPTLLMGDPCQLSSDFVEALLGFDIDPFDGVASGEHVWDPAEGYTERGMFMAQMEVLFHLAYGVRGAPMWKWFTEMSHGLPGLTGRQLHIDADNGDDPAVAAELALFEQYATEGRIAAVARLGVGQDQELRFRPEDGLWHALNGVPIDTDALLTVAADALLGTPVTVTAELPANISIGGADRQPLLDVDPDDRASEMIGDLLAIPEPTAAGGDTIRLGASYVDPAASVLVDGVLCAAPTCSFVPALSAVEGLPVIDLFLGIALTPGTHVVQVQNPNGWVSNEMPILAR